MEDNLRISKALKYAMPYKVQFDKKALHLYYWDVQYAIGTIIEFYPRNQKDDAPYASIYGCPKVPIGDQDIDNLIEMLNIRMKPDDKALGELDKDSIIDWTVHLYGN